jgi:hypothetical protein
MVYCIIFLVHGWYSMISISEGVTLSNYSISTTEVCSLPRNELIVACFRQSFNTSNLVSLRWNTQCYGCIEGQQATWSTKLPYCWLVGWFVGCLVSRLPRVNTHYLAIVEWLASPVWWLKKSNQNHAATTPLYMFVVLLAHLPKAMVTTTHNRQASYFNQFCQQKSTRHSRLLLIQWSFLFIKSNCLVSK